MDDNTIPDRLVFLDHTNPRSGPVLEHMAFFFQGIIEGMSYDKILEYLRQQGSNGENGTYIFQSCFAIKGKLFELVQSNYEYGIWFSDNHIDYTKMEASEAIHDIYSMDSERDGFFTVNEEQEIRMLKYYSEHEIDYIFRFNELKKIIQ